MDRRSRPGHLGRSLAGLALAAGLLALGSGAVLAADPSPEATPIVFNSPQYLVWWESHMTYNGPVVDQVYDLFTEGPVEPGHFVVPDGSGGVFHYSGRLVGGPYRTDDELCPQMIALGIEALQVWPPAMIGGSTIVDCERFRATPAPSPAPTDAGDGATTGSSTGGGNGGATGGSPDEPSDEALDIAAGLIGMLLFGGGLVGLSGGRSPRRPPALVTAAGGGPTVLAPPPAPLPVEAPPVTVAPPAAQEPPDPEPQDPCASQQADLDAASAAGRTISGLVEKSRAFEAMAEAQVVALANWSIPANVLVDAGWLLAWPAGGAVGKWLGARWLGKEALAKVRNRAMRGLLRVVAKVGMTGTPEKWLGDKLMEGAGKELIKVIFKDMTDIKVDDSILKMEEGAAKAYIKDRVKQGLSESGDFSWLSKRAGDYSEVFDDLAKQMSEIVGHAISVYNTTTSTAGMISTLNAMRERLLDLHETTSKLELELADVLNDMRFARERLDHCRLVNAPGWRP